MFEIMRRTSQIVLLTRAGEHDIMEIKQQRTNMKDDVNRSRN